MLLLRIWFSGPSFDTSFPYIGLQVLFKWACVCIGLQIRFDLMGTLKRPIPGALHLLGLMLFTSKTVISLLSIAHQLSHHIKRAIAFESRTLPRTTTTRLLTNNNNIRVKLSERESFSILVEQEIDHHQAEICHG